MLQPPATTATILIIDDQESNLRLLERVLISAGYQAFVSSTDPLKAVDLYRQVPARPRRARSAHADAGRHRRAGAAQRAHARGHLRAGPRDHRRPEPDDQAAGALGRRQGLPRQAVRSARSRAPHQEPARGPLALRRAAAAERGARREGRAAPLRAGGRAARDSRAPRPDGGVPRRRHDAAHAARRRDLGAHRRSARPARRPRQDAAARRAAARHRQDRRPRQHPAEAGQADPGRIRRHQDAHGDRRAHPVGQHPPAAADGRADRAHPSRALGRARLHRRPAR